MKDPYAVLGVPRTATPDRIKKSYRKLAAKHHPDKNPGDPDAQAKYVEIVTAFEIVGDPERRKRYDETGDTRRPDTHPDSELLSVLFPCVMEMISYHGRMGTLKSTDLVARMKDKLKSQLSEIGSAISRLQKGHDAVAEVIGRFTVEGEGENLLESAARSELRNVEAQLAMGKADQAKFARAVEYLNRCTYRHDKPGTAATALLGMLQGHYAVISTKA